ncbi:hypothetical protein IU462_30330, partial [Nocardia farcinica]|nr:hypothetical protein [Nocardia farcinica]
MDITPVMRRVTDAAVEKAYGGKKAIEWMEVYAGETHSFLVDIGDQHPTLGADPEIAAGTQAPILVDARWMRLSEIPERGRAFLWAAGLLSVDEFASEVESWGGDISYPG